jgi:hypothetical protein
MNRKGQQLWEVTLLLSVVLIAIAWFMSNQKTTSNDFHSGSSQVTHTADSKPFISLFNFTWSSSGDIKNKAATGPGASIVAPAPAEQPSTPPQQLKIDFGIPTNHLGHLSPWERFGMDLVIILVVMGVGGLLDALGGDHWLFCRRIMMPFLLGIGISAVVFSFYDEWYNWLTLILIMPMWGTLSLPYSNDGNFGRALWMVLSAVTGGLFLVLLSCFCHTHLLAWWLYIAYIVIAGIFGGKYKNWKQFKGDWITGSFALCSLILYVFLSLQLSL